METKIFKMVKMFPNSYENFIAYKVGEIIEVNGRHYPSNKFNKVVKNLCANGKITRNFVRYCDIYPEEPSIKIKIPVFNVI